MTTAFDAMNIQFKYLKPFLFLLGSRVKYKSANGGQHK